MRFVALLSGGKDGIYNVMECCRRGHELVCVAHLSPPEGVEEADSYMYQSAGSLALPAMAECLEVPLIRRTMSGGPKEQRLLYVPTEGDEVEDLFELLKEVLQRFPDVVGVACGAILSTYQRTRVESACLRLSLTPLAFLWRREQSGLLQDMLDGGVEAVLVKVASLGLNPRKHLGRPLALLQPHLEKLKATYGIHVCGEGGEYESLVLDCPIFPRRRLVLLETEVVVLDEDAAAPVGFLRVIRCGTEPKPQPPPPLPPWHPNDTAALLPPLPMRFTAPSNSAGGNAPANDAGGASCGSSCVSSSLMMPQEGARQLPLVCEQGALVCVSGVTSLTGSSGASCDVADIANASAQEATVVAQVGDCLAVISEALAARGLSFEDAFFVHMYLADIRRFKAANDAYCRVMPAELPPSRSCVEAALQPPHVVLLDCFALRGSGAAMRAAGGSSDERQVLHVRGMSDWAPLCIGPYCQANAIGASGAVVFAAGQIGLCSGDMSLASGGLSPQLQLSFGNTAAVLDAMGSSLKTGGACLTVYVDAEEVGMASSRWEWLADSAEVMVATNAHIASEARDDLSDSAEEGWCSDPEELAKEAAASARIEEPLRPVPTLLVAVPKLPRSAASEVEALALTDIAAANLRVTHLARRFPCSMAAQLVTSGAAVAAAAMELPGRWASCVASAASIAGDSVSVRGESEGEGARRAVIDCAATIAERVMCAAFCTATLGQSLRHNLRESWQTPSEAIAVPNEHTDGSEAAAQAGSDRDARDVTALLPESAADLEALCEGMLGAAAAALAAAGLQWRHAASLRVYFDSRLDGSAARDAILLALAGQTKSRPALAMVSVTAIGLAGAFKAKRLQGSEEASAAVLGVHVFACDLPQLRTQMWVRAA